MGFNSFIPRFLFLYLGLYTGPAIGQFRVDSIPGTWGGILEAGKPLRILFHFSRDQNGSLRASADSPDQDALGRKVDEVILRKDSLFLLMEDIHAVYTGVFDSLGRQITGTWIQGKYSFPLLLQKLPGDTSLPRLIRPQEPHPPFPYLVRVLSFQDTGHTITYGATLTLPPGKGPFAAVILISGSGQQDRNGTLMGHQPNLVLADYLTRLGLAVLRLDDRGIGGTTDPHRNFLNNTTADFVWDMHNAVDFLKSLPGIDPKKIGLVGRSEGGLIASMLAAGDPADIAFVVLLAAPGVPVIRLMTIQISSPLSRRGIPVPAVTAYRTLVGGALELIGSPLDPAYVRDRLSSYFQEWKSEQPDLIIQELKARQFSGQEFSREYTPLLSPWFRYFVKPDPSRYLSQLRCPVLALNGSLDVQVNAGENLPAIRQALEAGNNPDFRVLELTGLNHLFQSARTGEVDEYGMIEQTISPKVLRIIGDWILRPGRAGL